MGSTENQQINKSEPLWAVIIKVIFAIIVPNIGGMVGAFISTDSIADWYSTLAKPSWAPPNWLFAPMWVFLYSLMGIASYMVYRYGGGFKSRAKWPLLIYLVNLALNWTWSPVFFGAQNIIGGFITIIFVLITAIIEASAFSCISWIAGAMILPYIVWLTIATALNGWIYVNN